MGNRASPLGLLFPGCGPFWSCASGMTLQDLNKKAVGLQDLGRTSPSAKVRTGERWSNHQKGTWASRQSWHPANSSCRDVIGSISFVANLMGLKYD